MWSSEQKPEKQTLKPVKISDNYAPLISKTDNAVSLTDIQVGTVKVKVWRHVFHPLRQWGSCWVCQETYRALTPAEAPHQTDSVTQCFPSSCQTSTITQWQSELWQPLIAKMSRQGVQHKIPGPVLHLPLFIQVSLWTILTWEPCTCIPFPGSPAPLLLILKDLTTKSCCRMWGEICVRFLS